MLRQAELQAGFAAALRDPLRPPPAGVAKRFDVHRNTMAAGLIETLESGFPAVRRLVGEDFFRGTATAYLRAQPPRSPVLLLYGERFGDFLDDFAPAAAVPYLGDVARLEWARLAAYHATDAQPLPIARLAELPQAALPELRFVLHPSLHLLRSRFPVASLWAATVGDDTEIEVDMTRGEDIAVLRPALSVELRVLPPGGHAFIAALAADAPLSRASEAGRGAAPDFDLAAHLQGVFSLGAVVSLQPSDPKPQEVSFQK